MGGGSATLGEDTATTDNAPATLGTPGGGTAPGSGRRPTGESAGSSGGRVSGEQARVPDECFGPISDPRCPTASAPTGTGLGDRGTESGQPYGPADSPVQGGPPFTGPTGRPLDLPRE